MEEVFPLLKLLGHYVGEDVQLFSRLCRVLAHALKQPGARLSLSHFLRVKTDSACNTALALPRPTAAPTAALALQRHRC